MIWICFFIVIFWPPFFFLFSLTSQVHNTGLTQLSLLLRAVKFSSSCVRYLFSIPAPADHICVASMDSHKGQQTGRNSRSASDRAVLVFMNVKVSWSVSRAQLLTDCDETVKKATNELQSGDVLRHLTLRVWIYIYIYSHIFTLYIYIYIFTLYIYIYIYIYTHIQSGA